MANLFYMPRPDGLPAKIAENVRIECARLGWNQSDLARALGVTPSAVQKKWMGPRMWGLDELEPLASALGIPLEQLVLARVGYIPLPRLDSNQNRGVTSPPGTGLANQPMTR